MQPGQKINLGTEAKARLGDYLAEVIEDLEAEHEPLFTKIDGYWDLYEARPLTDVRNFPWKYASNVVVPLIRTWADAIIARHWTRINSTPKRWVARTENEAFAQILPNWMNYLNWAADDNVFDTVIPTWDWISEMVPLGSSVLHLCWENKIGTRYLPSGKTTEVVFSTGPRLIHIPRKDLLWFPGLSPMESPVTARRTWLSRTALVMHANQADWSQADLDSILSQPDAEGSSDINSTDVRKDDRRAGYAATGQIEKWDMREVWVDWPTLTRNSDLRLDDVDSKNQPSTVVVTMHRSTHTVARVVAHPYAFPHKPFYDIHFRKRSSRADSDGVARMAEHLQRQATTVVNQSNDAITLANSVNFVTTDRNLASWQFSPNQAIVVNNMDAIEFPTLSKQVVPDIALVNQMIAMGERLFSVGDPALGRETRLGGHPSPATSTLAMLEQMELNVGTSLRFIRKQMARLGEDISTLFQQFETDPDVGMAGMGRVEMALGSRDALQLEEILMPTDIPISGNVKFDLHALSESVNPEAERQKAVLVSQMTNNYYAQLLQLAQILLSPVGQDPLTRQISVQAMRANSLTMRRFLEASDVDEIEDFLVQLEGTQNDQLGQFDQTAQILARLAEERGGGPGGGASPIPFGGVGRGAAGPGSGNGRPVQGAGGGF